MSGAEHWIQRMAREWLETLGVDVPKGHGGIVSTEDIEFASQAEIKEAFIRMDRARPQATVELEMLHLSMGLATTKGWLEEVEAQWMAKAEMEARGL